MNITEFEIGDIIHRTAPSADGDYSYMDGDRPFELIGIKNGNIHLLCKKGSRASGMDKILHLPGRIKILSYRSWKNGWTSYENIDPLYTYVINHNTLEKRIDQILENGGIDDLKEIHKEITDAVSKIIAERIQYKLSK